MLLYIQQTTIERWAYSNYNTQGNLTPGQSRTWVQHSWLPPSVYQTWVWTIQLWFQSNPEIHLVNPWRCFWSRQKIRTRTVISTAEPQQICTDLCLGLWFSPPCSNSSFSTFSMANLQARFAFLHAVWLLEPTEDQDGDHTGELLLLINNLVYESGFKCM